MGCDIHAHLEIKIYDKWEHYSIVPIKRNYKLFGKLAGIRDECETPIAKDRGLPDDITVVTRLDRNYYGTDGHGDSFITWDEIIDLVKFYDGIGSNIGDMHQDVYAGISLFGDGLYAKSSVSYYVADVRMVFWFDN